MAFDWNSLRKQQYERYLGEVAARNIAARAAYGDQCETWIEVNIHNREMGLPLSAVPAVPRKEVLSDTGADFVTTWEAFPDLVAPVLPPVVAGGSGSLVTPGAPGDKLDTVLFALGVIKNDIDAIKKELGL